MEIVLRNACKAFRLLRENVQLLFLSVFPPSWWCASAGSRGLVRPAHTVRRLR